MLFSFKMVGDSYTWMKLEDVMLTKQGSH
jgi:hypothetical protein